MKVSHDNCDFSARNDQNDKHDEEKGENIVELMTPHRCQDEEQLDEHGAERQHTAHQRREHWRQIPHLFRNLQTNKQSTLDNN